MSFDREFIVVVSADRVDLLRVVPCVAGASVFRKEYTVDLINVTYRVGYILYLDIIVFVFVRSYNINIRNGCFSVKSCAVKADGKALVRSVCMVDDQRSVACAALNNRAVIAGGYLRAVFQSIFVERQRDIGGRSDHIARSRLAFGFIVYNIFRRRPDPHVRTVVVVEYMSIVCAVPAPAAGLKIVRSIGYLIPCEGTGSVVIRQVCVPVDKVAVNERLAVVAVYVCCPYLYPLGRSEIHIVKRYGEILAGEPVVVVSVAFNINKVSDNSVNGAPGHRLSVVGYHEILRCCNTVVEIAAVKLVCKCAVSRIMGEIVFRTACHRVGICSLRTVSALHNVAYEVERQIYIRFLHVACPCLIGTRPVNDISGVGEVSVLCITYAAAVYAKEVLRV